MAERLFVSQTSGPIVLGLSLPTGSVRVQVDDRLTTARIELYTDDTSGPAADAVNRAGSEQNGQALAIEVPKLPDNVMTQSVRGGRIVQNIGVMNFGTMTGVTTVNGRVVSGGSSGMQTVSPIEARVHLPARSSLAVVGTSTDAEIFGAIDQLEFRSVSGDLTADIAGSLVANTTSGDISVGRIADRISARTVSGDLSVDLYEGRDADLNSTSGDIEVQATGAATGTIRANATSGDVRVRGGRHLHVSAHSLSGRVRA
ncbi:DUF4097 family beta strand repeat-containing protein [Streptomyces sp. NPDC051684]|uniref:DUF4097 family beta strand repeat-containing protein n=1 Tax=Streptomyces sp. NPDC051684 TaxID=3365670 RepID=UPI0037968BD2